jgi:hypothetical protein
MIRPRLLAPAIASLALTGIIGLSAAPPALAATGGRTTAAAASTSAHQAKAAVSSTINQTTGAGTFTGTFTPTSFSTSSGQLNVTGQLTGTFTNLVGAVTQISQSVTTTVQNATTSGSCQILTLQLGPLHLDLLGLVVNLNQVNLTITAQSGPGNLLGNLLCAVAHLLDGGHLSGLTNLLNQLLGL